MLAIVIKLWQNKYITSVINNYMENQPIQSDQPIQSIESIHTGFWKRFIAFFIDIMIIGTVTVILSFLFRDVLLNLGENLWYIGFIILGFYFTILNSQIGKGQTIGKKILKIRVVYNNGSFLSASNSFARYLFLCPIIFYNGIVLSFDSLGIESLTMIYSMISIFIFLGIVGLVVLTKEKRGLHDYLLKTVVVQSKSINDVNVSQIDTLKEASVKHKKAFLSIFIIFILILITTTIISKKIDDKPVGGVDFKSMLELRKDLKDNYPLSNISVASGSGVLYKWEGGTETMQKRLEISAYVKYSIFNDDIARNQLYEQVHEQIVSTYPNIDNYDEVVIAFRTGYNLGIGRFLISDTKLYPVKSE